ncbi:AAA family ATPase [Bifidobacterium mongoliense]|uniref:AAA family ATPase n=1 Tax=Bifidobacterium mongoliense TaxID=518643 RepID=UPI0026496D59|nr:AAA family ATPase [Bifidobacterium mongoliense]MDN6024622.1 AAA family ATPase [Bifidobacterium mongoliense]MDN6050466.1 AAA family ATPase [Bifidobacterium mongoliense]
MTEPWPSRTITRLLRYLDMNGLFIDGVRLDWDAAHDGRTQSADSTDTADYTRFIAALSSLHELEFDNPLTFFTGENGTGKSTLLEAIAQAYGFNAEGGTRNYRFSTYDDVSGLSHRTTLIRRRGYSRSGYFFRAESFFNLATKAQDYNRSGALASLHEQSHGESFLTFMQSFDGPGLYLMDEPEAALSPQRQLSMMVIMHRLLDRGSQFIIATHSPILLSFPGAALLSFDDGQMHPCTVEDTDSHRVTEMIINRRDALLHHLFER